MALIVAAACLAVMPGCGDDGGTDVEITRPTVTQTSPEDGATDVRMVPLISISFSEEMDASSLTGIAVTGIVTHHVAYDTLGNQATVYISEALAGETAYEVTVPAAARDEEGHTLGTAYTFGFTTGPLTCDNAVDYLEPNSASNEVADIEIPCTYPVLSSCGGSDRYDYFGFTLEEAAKVTFKFQRVDGGPAVRWTAGFQRTVYQIYSMSDSLRTGEEVGNYYSFLPGTYTIRTGKQNEDEEIVFYSLTVEASTPCADDAYEDNDFAFEGTPIAPDHYENLVSCYQDGDYYVIDLTVGQSLTVTAYNVSGGSVDGGIYMVDPDYAPVAVDKGTHSPLSTSWTATAAGTHSFSVGWPEAEVEYTMDIEVD
jgi:hypothetical protein